ETFKNKPFLIFEANNFSYLIAQTILTTGVFYYIQFVLKLEGILAILPILLFFIMTFVFAQPMSKLVVKYGLKKVYIYSALLAGIGFFIGFFVGKIFIFVLIVFAFIGIGFSGISITQQAIFSDVIDYDEILTQKRRETSYSGINALVTKPSISIANYLFLLTLALYGFQRHLKSQTPSGELGIIVGFTILPGIFLILSALFLLRFPLDGAKWDEQKAQLKRIHDKKEKEYFQHLQTNDN
ncbi:MAG: MFS transporter, partial [Candidatus Hermodarchaeota archaeon]